MESSNYYNRARYYDQTVGRFSNEDPVRFSGGLNFYAYVRNDPVSFVDPMGLCTQVSPWIQVASWGAPPKPYRTEPAGLYWHRVDWGFLTAQGCYCDWEADATRVKAYYDNIYELQTAKQGSTTKESYTYDLVGNRLSSLGMSPYNYNPSNELTSTPSGSYTYDQNGNTQTAPGGKSYTWDFENRMASATVPGTGTVTFKYDPFGRRIQKSSASGTTNYLYDGMNPLEEVDSNGNLLSRYTQTNSLDEQLSELRASTTSYYETDGLGTVTSLSNPAGTLANTYTYDSFGNLTASSGTLTNPFRYTGREFDSETGIYEYRMRYYDQNIGRFISEDPIRFRGGKDFYLYVSNNPVNLTDALGLCDNDSCKNAAPMFSDSPACNDYGNETYDGVGLKCFCKCAGDSPWSLQVRGCLACEHKKGTNMTVAHARCYAWAGLYQTPGKTIRECLNKCCVGLACKVWGH